MTRQQQQATEQNPEKAPIQPQRPNPVAERVAAQIDDIVEGTVAAGESSTDLVVNRLVEKTMTVVNEDSVLPSDVARRLGDSLLSLLQNIVTNHKNATLRTFLIAFCLMALARYGGLTDLEFDQLDDDEGEQKIAEARETLNTLGNPEYRMIDTNVKSELANGDTNAPNLANLLINYNPEREVLQLPIRENVDFTTGDATGSTLFKFADGLKGLNNSGDIKITKLRLLLGNFEGNINDVNLVITDPNSTPQKGYAYLRATDAVNAAWLQIAVSTIGKAMGVEFDYVYDSANSQYVPAGDNLLILPPVIG